MIYNVINIFCSPRISVFAVLSFNCAIFHRQKERDSSRSTFNNLARRGDKVTETIVKFKL